MFPLFLLQIPFLVQSFQATLDSEKLCYLQKELTEERATFPVSRNTRFAFNELEVKSRLSFVPHGTAYSEPKLKF